MYALDFVKELNPFIPKNYLIFVNPHSGPGKAFEYFRKVEEIFSKNYFVSKIKKILLYS